MITERQINRAELKAVRFAGAYYIVNARYQIVFFIPFNTAAEAEEYIKDGLI